MEYTLNFRDIWTQTDALLGGIGVTLAISTLTIAVGLIIGSAGAAGSIYGGKLLRSFVFGYVEIIRNTPLIVQLFIVFFGLPSIGIRLSPLTATMIAISINFGAYSTEIIRAGLEAIPRSQIEAGQCLGLSGGEIFRYVVLPPAIKAVYPALTSQFLLVMLGTSVASQISTPDLFHVASVIQSKTFRDFEIYLVISIIYLALALMLKTAFHFIEKWMLGR
jgi:polar amino acid transport system permease protein